MLSFTMANFSNGLPIRIKEEVDDTSFIFENVLNEDTLNTENVVFYDMNGECEEDVKPNIAELQKNLSLAFASSNADQSYEKTDLNAEQPFVDLEGMVKVEIDEKNTKRVTLPPNNIPAPAPTVLVGHLKKANQSQLQSDHVRVPAIQVLSYLQALKLKPLSSVSEENATNSPSPSLVVVMPSRRPLRNHKNAVAEEVIRNLPQSKPLTLLSGGYVLRDSFDDYYDGESVIGVRKKGRLIFLNNKTGKLATAEGGIRVHSFAIRKHFVDSNIGQAQVKLRKLSNNVIIGKGNTSDASGAASTSTATNLSPPLSSLEPISVASIETIPPFIEVQAPFVAQPETTVIRLPSQYTFPQFWEKGTPGRKPRYQQPEPVQTISVIIPERRPLRQHTNAYAEEVLATLPPTKRLALLSGGYILEDSFDDFYDSEAIQGARKKGKLIFVNKTGKPATPEEGIRLHTFAIPKYYFGSKIAVQARVKASCTLPTATTTAKMLSTAVATPSAFPPVTTLARTAHKPVILQPIHAATRVIPSSPGTITVDYIETIAPFPEVADPGTIQVAIQPKPTPVHKKRKRIKRKDLSDDEDLDPDYTLKQPRRLRSYSRASR